MNRLYMAAVLLAAVPAAAFADAFTWGENSYGELADTTYTDRSTPVAADTSGVLGGKTLTTISTGGGFVLTLGSDGKAFGWGNNWHGNVGNGAANPSEPPVEVDMTGVLSGKRIIAVAAGYEHSLALTDDGKVYSWGYNSDGCLGNTSVFASLSPVEVDMTGALSGKTVVAIAASEHQSYALDSNGNVYGWGNNVVGGVGDGTTTQRDTPVAVDTSGVLSGKFITAISAYPAGCLALASDGTVYGWGSNGNGQLGDGSTTHRHTPVALDMTGVLSGKTITAIEAGQAGALALASNGRIYAWGYNAYGQLGDGTTTQRTTPVAVSTAGVLSGKTITAISMGLHSLALSSDGDLYSWGYNASGQLGDGTTTDRTTPVAVTTSGVLSGKTITAISAASTFSVVLAESTVSTFALATARSYAANFGWLNWRPRATGPEAPAVHMHVLSGKVYAANVGWIDLGDGAPADDIRYSQAGGDIGVNHDGSGGLHGYAYGASIGWIKFAQTWQHPPRLDLSTGLLSGYAYSANCGWIGLAGLKTGIAKGKDTDLAGHGDGIDDAWEFEQLAANGLPRDLSLIGSFADDDSDHDGYTDVAEYLADTNPLSAASAPAAPAFVPLTGNTLRLEWAASGSRSYQVQCSSDFAVWDPVGGLITSMANTGSVDVAIPPGAPRLFFKVQPQLPLQP